MPTKSKTTVEKQGLPAKEYNLKYLQRPEVKKHLKKQRQESYNRPEVKERISKISPKARSFNTSQKTISRIF